VAGSRARLHAQAAAPRATQEALLRDILARHAGSAFGVRHGFGRIASLSAYRDAVPVCEPEQLAFDIEAMADGDARRLVDEPIVAFERTGGSTGGARLIPFTASGLACLQQGLYAWLDDLCLSRPAIMEGSSYWSISPAGRAPQRTASGVAIGIASDAEYFGEAARSIAGLLAVPPAVGAIEDIGEWRAATLRFLLEDPSLALVSVWSPTFWLELCRHAVERRAELAAAIADRQRAAAVLAALSDPVPRWSAIWPRLALLSCWTDASALPWAAQLQRQFPSVEIQGKGLLATEGMVSLPLCDGGEPVAAIASTVLEFEDDGGRALACDELATGGEYGVLMTTSAGLYRYRLGDRVRVSGLWRETPRLTLLGRTGIGSDLCGEKLTEAFVMRCWEALRGADARGFAGRLVPQADPRAHYRLVVDAAEHDGPAAARLAASMDLQLRANPQYAYARALGQLDAIAPVRVPHLAGRLQALATARGQRLGDAKPGILGRLGEPALAELAA
jgi:hypothetical protein